MNFFFKLHRLHDNYKMITKEKISENTDKINKLSNLLSKIHNTDDIYLKQLVIKFNQILVDNQYYIYELFNIDLDNVYSILSNDFMNDFYIIKITEKGNNTKIIGKVDEIKDKYDTILYDFLSELLYKKIKNKESDERERLLYNNRLKTISYLYQYLNIGGTFVIRFMALYDIEIIDIYYILCYMFENVIIYSNTRLICTNFNPVLTRHDLEEIILNNQSIEPKTNLNNLLEYLSNNLDYQIKKTMLLLEMKKDEYLSMIMNEMITSCSYYNKKIVNKVLIMNNNSILEQFKSIYIDNKLVDIKDQYNGIIGSYLQEIIEKNDIKKCLEIGMEYGIISFYILSNLKTELISIDSYQKEKYNNYGIKMLNELKLDNRHKLYRKKPCFVLPHLLQKNDYYYYDFIYINSFHTFDYSLINFFYSDLLLKINGFIIIDNVLDHGVAKCIKYIETNYLNYRKIDSPITIAVFTKNKQDDREWNFHKQF